MISKLTAPLPPLPQQQQQQQQAQHLRDVERERERAAFSSMQNESRALQPRAPERGNHSFLLPSERRPLQLTAPERGNLFLASDEHALAKQIELLHSPDARSVNVRPLLSLVEEVIENATQTIEGHAQVMVMNGVHVCLRMLLYVLCCSYIHVW